MGKNTLKFKKSTAIILAVSLMLTLMIAFGGCKAKTEEEPTVSVQSNYTQDAYAPVDDSNITTETPAQTDAPAQTQAPQTTQTTQPAQTQAQTVIPADVSGVTTITDGSKTVVYPKALESASKRYPVIVWANGTGCATSTYMSLLETLANGGYIVVADSSVMTADGASQRDSIDYIISANSNSSSVFCSKVDTASIGASGHSQGGRSSVNAAQADSRIKCIVSIAGASSAQEANGLKAPALFLTGTSDMIVVSSQWCKPSYDAVAGRAVYASLKNGVHTTCMTDPEKVSGYVISWFDAYLKNDSNAKNVFAPGGKLATDSAWQDFASKN